MTVVRLSNVRRRRNAEAQRRFRARNKKCQASSWVDYSDRVLSMLISRRYLSENEVANKSQVRRALTLFLADIAQSDDFN